MALPSPQLCPAKPHLVEHQGEVGQHEDHIVEASSGTVLVNACQQCHVPQFGLPHNLHRHLQQHLALLLMLNRQQQKVVVEAGGAKGCLEAAELSPYANTELAPAPPPLKKRHSWRTAHPTCFWPRFWRPGSAVSRPLSRTVAPHQAG